MRLRPRPQVAQAAPAADPAAPPAADAPPPPADPAPPPATDAPPAPATPAGDQTNVASTPQLTDEELAKLAEQEAKTEVITVTGSLIGRKEVDSPSPVSVVDKQKLEGAGITNVGDILQKIPAQGNAINAQNNNGGDGSVRINLRSLGSNRTLVLLNGRRVVPSGLGADASVDFGTLPLAMIERVEVLKDGASAIYGSDAVAGVVNVITRSNFNGTEASVYASTSQRGDGQDYDLSFVTGHSTAKGNVTFAAGFQQQRSVLAGDRDFSSVTRAFDYSCTDAGEAAGDCIKASLSGSSNTPTGRLNTMPGGKSPVVVVPGCTTKFCTADGKGGFRNYISPTATAFNDAYNFQTLNYLFTPSTRVNIFSNGNYELSKNVHAFFEGQFNSRKSAQQLAEEPLPLGTFGVTLSKDSIYNPFGSDIVDYNRRLTEFGTRDFKQAVSTSRVVVGLNGNIPEEVPVLKNWRWEVSYDYGRTDSTNSNSGDLILSHLTNALGPSFIDPTAGPQCGGGPDTVIPGCVPLSLLTPGQVTKPMINYLTFVGTTSGLNEQHTAQASASGKLVDLPNHGDISLAVGADYRHEEGANQPDPLTATGDTTGNAIAATQGTYHLFEGFGELSVVPISGLEYLKWVELDAAARAYDYNTFGSGITGKISALIRTAGGLALRGTYGNAFRAPNISELFSGQADSFPLINDPCDVRPPGSKNPITLSPTAMMKCAGTGSQGGVPMNSEFGTTQQRAKIGGNTQLQPEKAKVGTAGVVFEPLSGLDFTVDYWHIQIDNAITNLPVQTVLSQCYDAGVDSFCKLINRDPGSHVISSIIDQIQNVGGITTSGLDFSAAYQYKTDVGTFRHSIEGTYLFQYNVDTGTVDPDTKKEQILHGKGFYDLGINPDVKFNIFTLWSHPSGFDAGFNFRFIDSFQECEGNNCNDPTSLRRGVAKYATGDLFIDYALKSSQGTTRVAVGMNNVNDAKPPVIYNGAALNADSSAYDFMGRNFYIRLSQLF